MPASTYRFIKSRSCMLASAAVLAVISANEASAQSATIETVTVTAQANLNATAPTQTPLDSVQPTSIITQDFIEKNLPLSGNYDEAIKLSPSVANTAPNGPGLAESQGLSIRGFVDGQFNVTFDGIPWGDSNDFTHHSTSYFMAHDLGQITVDRGPGTGATIGNATFGGTVSILSKAPTDDEAIRPYASTGSFNTQLVGAEFDSGTIDKTNGTRVMLDVEGLSSDGYLTNMGQRRQNAYIKVVQPIDSNTTIAFVGMFNHIDQNISLGATAAEISAFGPNYALSRDPTNQNYFRYNADSIRNDFEYVDLQSNLGGGWAVDSKLYTFAYYHKGLNGEDPNGELPNGTSFGPNNVPGQLLKNDYRYVGTITRVTKDFSFGQLKTGIWYDYQTNQRNLTEIDFTANQAVNPAGNPPTGIDRDLHQALTTIQPYAQFDWKPIDGLVISPGVRYSYFDRNVNSIVNVKTGSAQIYDNSFDALLPSIAANYTLMEGWTTYAQVAEGFLAPNENFFNTADPNATKITPQKSWNVQAGTSFQAGDWTISGDVYNINFSNLIGSRTVGGQAVFFNQGGATYKGLEADLTYSLGYGLSIYGNGSLNSAKDHQTHQWLANAPEETAALGLIYNQDGYYGSLIDKWIGGRYGDVGQTQWLQPYSTLDMSLGFDLSHWNGAPDGTWIKLQVNNLIDTNKIFALAGYTVQDGTPLYWTVPGRSVFVSISTSL